MDFKIQNTTETLGSNRNVLITFPREVALPFASQPPVDQYQEGNPAKEIATAIAAGLGTGLYIAAWFAAPLPMLVGHLAFIAACGRVKCQGEGCAPSTLPSSPKMFPPKQIKVMGDGHELRPSFISLDATGRFAAFNTPQPAMPHKQQTLLLNIETGAQTMVSENRLYNDQAMSGDAKRIVFESGARKVFYWDQWEGGPVEKSVATGGAESPVMSHHGKRMVYQSYTDNRFYYYDFETGKESEAISAGPIPEMPIENHEVLKRAVISGDGNKIAFLWSETDTSANQTGIALYLYEVSSKSSQRIPLDDFRRGQLTNGFLDIALGGFNEDGTKLSLTMLPKDPTIEKPQAYIIDIKDPVSPTVTLISTDTAKKPANLGAKAGPVSADGCNVLLETEATNMFSRTTEDSGLKLALYHCRSNGLIKANIEGDNRFVPKHFYRGFFTGRPIGATLSYDGSTIVYVGAYENEGRLLDTTFAVSTAWLLKNPR